MKQFTLFAGLAALTLGPAAFAQITVEYGHTSPVASYLDASGATITGTDLNDIQFQLGFFDTTGGFAPNASNGNLWLDRWTPFADAGDLATPNTAGGFPGAPAQGSLSLGLDSTGGATGLTPGAKLYLWGFQTGQQSFDGTSREWLLLSNDNVAGDFALGVDPTDIDAENWIVPVTDQDAVDDHSSENDNLTVASADEAIVGSNTATQVQFGVVVPEPSSVMLLSLSGLALLRRKR